MSENTITPIGLLSSYLEFFQNIWAFFRFYNRQRISCFSSIGIRKPLIYLFRFVALRKAVCRFGKPWNFWDLIINSLHWLGDTCVPLETLR